MQDNMHPKYVDTTITCACGNVIHTRSTKENIRVDSEIARIRSLPASRSSLIPADAWTCSRSVTAYRIKNKMLLFLGGAEMRRPVFFKLTGKGGLDDGGISDHCFPGPG